MKLLNVVILGAATAAYAFALDVPITPEVGLDGPTIVSAIGVLVGGLLILRSRRK